MAKSPAYSRSVFINCPFDDEYRPLMRAIVFAIEACGFAARSALEVSNSGEPRIEKIIRIIRESRFGIHDISRTELNSAGLPRFNMPFELGVFLGLRAAGGAQGRKVALVLDRDRYRYQQFLSDLSGHDNDPKRAVAIIRDWFSSQSANPLPGKATLVEAFEEFGSEIPRLIDSMGLTVHDLHNFPDFHHTVRTWIEKNFPTGPSD